MANLPIKHVEQREESKDSVSIAAPTALLCDAPTTLLTTPLGGQVEQQVDSAKTGVLHSKVEEMKAPAYTGPLGG